MNVSVVVPVYNEEDSVGPLAEELSRVAEKLPGMEIIFSDDGSRDGTWAKVEACCARWSFMRGIRSEQNQGQSAAMLKGLREAKGEVVVTMDGDLQNNPMDIPKLVESLGDADAACGYRHKRKDTWSRRVGSRLANRVRNWVTHDGVRDTGCSLKAFRRVCVNDLPPLDGMHRFMPAYFRLHGRRIVEEPVDHRGRQFGVSKYTNLKRLPRTIKDLMGFSWYQSRFLRGLD